MNPLFLLLGLFGAGIWGTQGSKSTTTTSESLVPTNDNEDDETPDTEQNNGQIPTPPVQDSSAPVVVDEQNNNDAAGDEGAEEQNNNDAAGDEGAEEQNNNDAAGDEGTGTVDDPNPSPPTQTGNGTESDGGENTVITTDGTVEVMAGRVATLSANGDDITSVSIISGVDHGRVTVNPDNTFALVMTKSDFTGSQSFTYEATHSDGSTTAHQIDLNVIPGVAINGWSTGEAHYMLETDADNNIIVEHGENHETVYVSGANSAYSRAEIASIEGLSVNQINGEWLANSNYGRSEEMALDTEAGTMLFTTLSPAGSETSNWLLFERGYTYDGVHNNRLVEWGAEGESELHPLYVGAWGEGERPILEDGVSGFGDSFTNLVIQGIEFQAGMTLLEAENVILDDVAFSDDQLNLQYGEGLTVRNSTFFDIVTTHDEAGSISNGEWQSGDFTQGAFMKAVEGLLIENNVFDLNGWSQDYHVDGSIEGGQPPQMFNHNIYIQTDNLDVTVRDSIFMRGSLNGLQVRSGGFVEDNVMISNNVAGNFHDYAYTLFTDNLVTDAGNKQAPNIGFETAGFDASLSNMASMVDNIIAHMVEPGSGETVERTDWAYRVNNPYYDDTIVWNWEAQNDSRFVSEQNVDGLDENVLNATTIQQFTAQLLGQSDATLDDLGDYLRGQANGAFDDVVDSDLIIRFFQEGFGIAPDIRTGAETIRFIPDDLGEGIRWDNRLNWETEDLPGLYAADSADLGGNHVVFGTNATIDTLDMGPDGALDVYGGKLSLTGGFTGDSGSLGVEGAGQVWTEGSDANDLDIDVTGGRFANTGDMAGADLTATGGQTILATGGAEYDVSSSKTLAVFEAAAKVGFDGNDGGMAILDMQEGSTLAFAAQDGDLGTIEEFRSGAFDDAPDIQSGIDLGNADLSLDLSGLNASAGTAFTLMDADELVGIFNEAGVSGLGGRDARIVVDYENDSVTLELSSGNGSVSVDTIGEQTDVTSGEEALWAALTNGQGVVSETAAMLPEEDEDLLDAVA